ncbi:VWA domain-containing protein [Desulfosporosinus youngiae]|uniref:VWA domain-containing protein n=1 Tax=Desulfosporosinus youngiae TaxID=339862 RepID=UPI0005A81D28|nr:VWA domain-containing protein [Desulfosporosinus youngiae]
MKYTGEGINKNREIRKLITYAAILPLFWQFIGIGRENYGILEKLDTIEDRVVDNANFFALDDIGPDIG